MTATPLSPSGEARARLTVLILAKNEEGCIARAVQSVAFADEVLILDSGSTDRTVEIAEGLGARVVHQDWLGWGKQHRRGVELATHDWLLSIDSDEIVTPQLAVSIQAALAAGPDPRNGYVVDRQDEFLGRLMPSMRRRSKRMNFIRLFNRRFGNWDPTMLVHEEIRVPGAALMLDGPLLHWRNYSISAQMQTLDRNSDLEGRMLSEAGKASALMLFLKPLLRFGWIYIVSGCWKLGPRGFIWAGLHASGEFLRQAKAWERQHVTPMPDPPASVYAAPDAPPPAPARRPAATEPVRT